jgi:hypothetical protein
MRILGAYDDTYRSYRVAIVQAIKYYRPYFVVLDATLRELAVVLAHFNPHAVVCSHPSAEFPSAGKGAWVELPTEPARIGDICIGGEHEGVVNLDLRDLLGVLDEIEERLRRGTLAQSC